MSFNSNIAPTIGLLSLGFSWLVWRLWSFTIHPKLHRNSPKVIPYSVPWFGHIVDFFRDGNALVTTSRLHYAPNREPFNIYICGQNTYIITSAKDTSAVFRNITDLTFDAYVRDLLLRFGISQTGFKAVWAKPSQDFVKARAADKGFPNPNAKSLMHSSEDIMKIQLHPGAELEVLSASLMGLIHQQMAWDAIPESAILNRNEQHSECIVSLKEWTKVCMLEVATKAFFGEALMKLDPTIPQTFAAFDDDSWKFTYNLPQFFAKNVYRAKANLHRAFTKYVELSPEERSDACWLIKTLEAEMRAVGSTDSDISAYFLLVFWPLHGNPWKLTFWLVSHLLYQPELKQRLFNEINPLFITDDALSSTKLSRKLEDCSLLTAIYHETLRLTSSTITVRDAVNDCVIGNKVLRKGSRVLIPYRQMFLDESVFGPNTVSFNPDRFLNNPSLAKDPSFRPFGGGLTYCPGRFLARTEIYAVVAMMVGKFKIELENPAAPFPQMDEKKPGLGTMFPAENADVFVRVSRR